MRKIIAVILFICLSIIAIKAQSDSVVILDSPQCLPLNYIVMVNGKLPLSVNTTITFDTIIYKDTICYNFYYNTNSYSYGSVHRSEILPDIFSNIPDTAIVYIEYQFQEAVGVNKWKDHSYRDTLTLGTFCQVRFVNINDISKKTYYINYIIPPPEHIIKTTDKFDKRRFYKKISRGWMPYGYMGKKHPLYF